MPERLGSERARFILDDSDFPLLILAVGRDVSAMPEVRGGSLAADGEPLAEWRLMARLTLSVLDGPGDEWFLIGPLVTQDTELLARWCDRSDELGRAGVVLVRGSTPADLTPEVDPRGRGGVVLTIPPARH